MYLCYDFFKWYVRFYSVKVIIVGVLYLVGYFGSFNNGFIGYIIVV